MTPASNELVDSPKNNALKTGPPLIGIILNWWLFGILFMQYLLYLSHETRKDKKTIRAIVHILFLLDIVQSILIVEDAFRCFVFNFGDYESLGRSGIPGIDGPFLDCIIAMTVQSVYCWRIWVLSQWRALPTIIVFLSFISGVSGFVNGLYEASASFVDNIKIDEWYIPGMLWLWTSVATDIFIAATMTYLLKFKTRGCSRGIKAVAQRLVILTLETNTLTAMAAMMVGILGFFPALGPPFTNLHRAVGYNLGKLYSNCFMVLLNQRIYYEEFSQEERTTTELGTLEFAPISSSRSRSGIANPDTTGEVSIIQFSEIATQADFKPGPGDDVELGKV